MQQYMCLSIAIVMSLRHGYTNDSVVCPMGVWGPGCIERCPDACRDNCSSQGLCYDCITGYFGIRCNQTCPPNCSGGLCYNVSCEDGCKPGWYGNKCDQSCHCQSGICERNTGKCMLVPQRFVLPNDESSTHSIPKKTCLNEDTVHRCKSKSCFQDNGTWVCDGCVDGFKGRQCSQHCPRDCKSCKQFGSLCTECRKGFYGRTCHKRCTKCKDGCHLRYAKCQGHCVEGYYGPLCSRRCGINCKTRTARLGTCHQDTGTCSLGCNDGYYGDVCQRKCFRNCTSASKFKSCHSVCRRENQHESVPEAAFYNGSSTQQGTVHEATYISGTVVVAVIIAIVVVGFIVVFATLNWCVLPAKRKTERKVQVMFMVPREELPHDSDIYDENQGNETASNTSMLGSNHPDDHARTYLMLPPYVHSANNHRIQLERESEHHYESLDSIYEGDRNINIQDGHGRFSAYLARPYIADRGQASYV